MDNKNEIRNFLGFSENENIFVYSGRVEEDKNVLLLIEVFLDIISKRKDVSLVIATQASYSDYYEKCINLAKQSNKITFYFNLDSEKMCKIYNFSDYFISLATSWYESFGRAPLEALACEIPVIVPNYNGFRENISKEYCYFLEPNFINKRWKVKKEDVLKTIYVAIEEKDFMKSKLSDKSRKSIKNVQDKILTNKNMSLARSIIDSYIKIDIEDLQNKKISLDKYPQVIKNIFLHFEGKTLEESIISFLENPEITLKNYNDNLDDYYEFVFKHF